MWTNANIIIYRSKLLSVVLWRRLPQDPFPRQRREAVCQTFLILNSEQRDASVKNIKWRKFYFEILSGLFGGGIKYWDLYLINYIPRCSLFSIMDDWIFKNQYQVQISRFDGSCDKSFRWNLFSLSNFMEKNSRKLFTKLCFLQIAPALNKTNIFCRKSWFTTMKTFVHSHETTPTWLR